MSACGTSQKKMHHTYKMDCEKYTTIYAAIQVQRVVYVRCNLCGGIVVAQSVNFVTKNTAACMCLQLHYLQSTIYK